MKDNDPQTSQTGQLRAETLTLFAPVVGPLQRGPDVRPYRHRSGVIGDGLFRDMCTRLAIPNLLECGAYDAAASIIHMKGGGKRALAIEANPKVFERKTKRAADVGVDVLNVGLAAETGSLRFYLPEGQPFPSAASFRAKNDRMASIEVLTRTVDDIIDAAPFDEALAMWVDVEGYAFEVLQGARRTLASPQCQILKVEMEDTERWKDQRTMSDVAPAIEGFGFVPVFCDIEFVGQFNVVYVRPEIRDAVDDLVTAAVQDLRALAATQDVENLA